MTQPTTIISTDTHTPDQMREALRKIWESSGAPTQIIYGRSWATEMRDQGYDPDGRFLALLDSAVDEEDSPP